MHLILATRGIQSSRDTWKTFMQAQMFTWKRKNLVSGQDEYGGVQGALRPIELWEYVFPAEHLEVVLGMMNLSDYVGRPEINKYAWFLRKMLKLKDIPKFPIKPQSKFIPMMGMAVYPIGIKDDVVQDFPNYGYHQEGL